MQRDKLSDDRLPAATPGWKQLLWHDISSAAKVKDAFEESDYDGNGDLKIHSAKFAELCTWLVRFAMQRIMKSSAANEHVCRTHDVLKLSSRQSDQHGVASLTAVGS